MARKGPIAEPPPRPNLPLMYRIEQIRLTQFKNHPDTSYSFHSRVVGITGQNGVGKTNLLDAIHTLCFSRGYFSRTDQTLIRHGDLGFRIDGILQKSEHTHEVSILLRETGKKEIRLDGDLLPRLADHLGRFPVVMIAPDDAELIQGESRARRQFLDALISQLTPAYLPALARYNKILQQRQALLQEIAEQGSSPTRLSTLDVLDDQWTNMTNILVPERRKWSIELQERMLQQYQRIAGTSDRVSMTYLTELDGSDVLSKIRTNRSRDLAAQRNTIGPHRDDLLFLLGDHPFKQVASQGQRKTLLFAIKLAERSLLEDTIGIAPVLLLDDVFEKLDPARILALMQWVTHDTLSQVFITDTDAQRLRDQLDPLGTPYELLEIKARI